MMWDKAQKAADYRCLVRPWKGLRKDMIATFKCMEIKGRDKLGID